MHTLYRNLDIHNTEEIAWAARVYCESPQYWRRDWKVSADGLRGVESRITASCSSPHSLFLVAEAAVEHPIGFHWLVTKRLDPRTAEYSGYQHSQSGGIVARRVSLWVHPDFWNRGIATELMTRGEHWARKMGAKAIWVTVHSSNAQMIAMNLKRGFTSEMLEMSKHLDPIPQQRS